MTDGHNIVLIGMPGAGKSTVGVILAKRLAMGFIDTDVSLQQATGATLQQLIGRHGPEEFLALESAHVCALDVDNTVIATGGSVVYSTNAMAHLTAKGVVVYLDVPLATLETRLANLDERGVVSLHPGQSLAAIADERMLRYRAHAQITIPCGEGSPETVVQQIITACARALS